ncbi:13727_t:CDS:2, partial [Ambispora leptoticha]
KLEALKEELQSSSNNLLSDHSANNLSLELTKHIFGEVSERLLAHESTIKDDVENFLQVGLPGKFLTKKAIPRSINTLVNNKLKEIKKKIKDIEAVLIAEIANVWILGAKSSIKSMVEKSRGKAAYNYVERFSSVFGIGEKVRRASRQIEHLDMSKKRIQWRAMKQSKRDGTIWKLLGDIRTYIAKKTDGELVELNKLMVLNQPSWQIIVPKPSTDSEISNMRGVVEA